MQFHFPSKGTFIALVSPLLFVVATMGCSDSGEYDGWVTINDQVIAVKVWERGDSCIAPDFSFATEGAVSDSDRITPPCDVTCVEQYRLKWSDARADTVVSPMPGRLSLALRHELPAGGSVGLEVRGCLGELDLGRVKVPLARPEWSVSLENKVDEGLIKFSWNMPGEAADLVCAFLGEGTSSKWRCDADVGLLEMGGIYDPSTDVVSASRFWHDFDILGISIFTNQYAAMTED